MLRQKIRFLSMGPRILQANKAPAVPLFGEEPQWTRYLENLKTQHPGLWARIQKNKLEGQSLGFAWVTPKSLARGLEGGIIARLCSTPELNLIGTRMLPSSECDPTNPGWKSITSPV